jgi:hypothetical protein
VSLLFVLRIRANLSAATYRLGAELKRGMRPPRIAVAQVQPSAINCSDLHVLVQVAADEV